METLAFNIADKLLSRLASRAYQEISSALSVKVELDNLKETLETITLVLQDAEKKQTTNPLITHWLRKLNDICYDADDVLDDFEYQKRRMQVLNRGSIKGKVRNFFSCRNSLLVHNRMSHMIKDIRERLGKIENEKNEFSLVAGDLARGSQDKHKEVRDETSSHIQASDVLGRDGDAEKIIVHLLKGNSEDEDHNVSILSMVGPGGIGKTTLAKLVYNDERVVENFKLQMWVCVSDEFVNKRLLGEIINLAVGEKCDTNESLQQMQIKLQNGLGGQKFLLVLDDVWDTKHVGVTTKKWDEFKTLLNVGGNGSKIIITTRSQSVATLTGSIYVHQLKGLPHEDCMSLFKRKAFIKRDEEQHGPRLMHIAEDIVRKCGGVPLALATVGSSLRWKKDLHDWMQVRDNDIWKEEGILPALKLSYDSLPPYLKPCFAYCSLFPKNYEFEARHLVPLWMAEGFLQSLDENKEFEEIGLEYIRQLCSRSLFQNLEVKNPMVGLEFTMHDLAHDLAISVAQLECWSLTFRPPVAFGRVRHFSISAEDLSAVTKHAPDEFILQLNKVRTILIPKVEDVVITNQSFFRTCISRFKYLRVLDMSDLGWLEVLPSSIGDLCHLRHLDLSYNTMIEKLPDSICKLHNLQTLILLYCNQLKKLPKDIGNLVSLINFIVTTKQMHLPKTFKCLTSLQLLYIDSCDNLKSLGEEIQCLTNLRKLYIFDCENLELLPLSDWKSLTQLHTLCIGRCNENPGIVEYGEDIWSRIALITNSIAPGRDGDHVEFEKDEDMWNQLID